MLLAAGYPLIGIAVIFASLETARGGLVFLNRSPSKPILSTSVAGLFEIYALGIKTLCRRANSIGRILDERPFLCGALIKIPLRLEFIFKNLLAGDWIGVGVSLSWMILGDGGLAVNDDELRSRLQED